MADKKKSDLIPRLTTAVVAIPILLYFIFFSPAWAFALLVVWAGATSTWEYCNIVYGDEHKPGVWLSAFLGAGVVSVVYFWGELSIAALCVSALVLFLFFLFNYRDQKQASKYISASVTGVVYGSLFMSCLALLYRDAGAAGPLWVLLILVIVWFSDTGAYFTGKAFGKRKLYEAVSPNKSIEGAVGGFVVSVGTAVGLNIWFPSWSGTYDVFGLETTLSWTSLELWQILLVAIPANFLGQMGDLAESLIKRAHGVKDSGTIIYGHGGMLDRIDALIFAVPWVYICHSNIL